MHRLVYLIFLIPLFVKAQYTGTASVSQGVGTVTNTNIYTCQGGRITSLGVITALDSTVWIIPAVNNYQNSSFPFASDLYNSCNGNTFQNDSAALNSLNDSNVITIDPNGSLITAYIFADNYFEMYINGIPVGKDLVPFTQFNSSIVRFRVNRPFTISILLVDWEEQLGIGCESNNGFLYHMGDGGVVAVFKDSLNNIIAATDSNWRAQTFYTAPIIDLNCTSEIGSLRISDNCSTADSNNGTAYYGLHWNRPLNWSSSSFDDSSWPNATTYSNIEVGVNNKPAYTNFINIFDDPSHDAEFIWSTNLILDNEVVIRHTVSEINSSTIYEKRNFFIYPNPANDEIKIMSSNAMSLDRIQAIEIYNYVGQKVLETNYYDDSLSVKHLTKGIYLVYIISDGNRVIEKLLVQ